MKKQRKERKNENWYIRFARFSARHIKAPEVFKKREYSQALEFLGWKLTPAEVNASALMALLLGLVVFIPLAGLLIYSAITGYPLPFIGIVSINVVVYLLGFCFITPFFLSWYFQTYILRAAENFRRQAITTIPELVNYLVMRMKLSPNLEKAVEFAAEHAKGKIAEDLKTMLWNTKIGVYKSIEEGLDDFAYKWGAFSDDFKHALMLIRSSVMEVDEAKRHMILEKALKETLEGVSEKMNKYAAEMRQPSIYLYYVGVLLPLMLIIMLPIGAMMAKLPLAKTEYLVLMYNVMIPLFVFFFANNILSKRPPVYIPPKIPDTYPGLPKKGFIKIGKKEVPIVVIALLAALLTFFVFAYFLDPVLNPNPLYTRPWDTEAIKAYYPFFKIAGAVMAGVIFASVYLYASAKPKRKIQKKIMSMEKEFQDSIYVIASRLGENRPAEEAISYTANFLAKSDTAELFKKTYDNISNLGMTVEAALFDPNYGSLKNIPSEVIRNTMRLVVDSMSLGVQQAARSLISLSMQLRDSEKIKEKIITLLGEITAMMKSIAFLIGPLVLGITTALQKIIISALKSIEGQQAMTQNLQGVSLPMMRMGDTSMLSAVPSPTVFLLIMALYVIEVTLLLLYFISRIEEPENNIALSINIAKSLPIATFLFFISAWFGSMISVAV